VDEDLPVIEVKDAVRAWLRLQPEIFLACGVRRFWDSCIISVEKLDDYVKK